jgi:hypothetical protein
MEVQLAWTHYPMLLRTLVWAGQTNPSMLSHLTIFNVTLFHHFVRRPTKTIFYLEVTRNSGYETDQTSEFVLTLGQTGWDRKRSSRLKHEVFTSILNPQKEAVSDAFAEVRADGVVYQESRGAGERTLFR